MGVDFAASASAARDYPLHKCGHGEGLAAGAGYAHGEERAKGEGGEAGRGCSGGHVSAADCIRAAIGESRKGGLLSQWVGQCYGGSVGVGQCMGQWVGRYVGWRVSVSVVRCFRGSWAARRVAVEGHCCA